MIAAALPRASEHASALRAVANETGKGLRLMWQRRVTLVMATVTLAMTYLIIEFFVGGGHINHAVLKATLPALFAYALAGTAALQGSGGVAEEINAGTIEQTQLSPVRPLLLVLGRLGALAAEGLILAAVLVALFWAGFGLHYTVRPDVLVPMLLTIVGAVAYGLLIVALTIAVTGIGAVVHVFNMTIMFFGGMFVPVTAFPYGIGIFAGFVPTALGVRALNATLAGQGLGSVWAHGTLPWLLVHTVALFVLGSVIYAYALRRAARDGGLGSR